MVFPGAACGDIHQAIEVNFNGEGHFVGAAGVEADDIAEVGALPLGAEKAGDGVCKRAFIAFPASIGAPDHCISVELE